VAVLIAFGVGGTLVYGQTESTGSSDWNYEIAPYFLWAVGLAGEVTVQGSTADVDLSFSDILDDLDFMFDFHFEAHHANGWGYAIEPMFIQLESEAEGPMGGDITSETDIVMMEGLVVNRFGSKERPFDLIWGIRYMGIDSSLDFPVLPSVDGDQDWLDGVVGVRYQPKLSDRWGLSLRGDVATGGSDFTWNAAAVLSAKMSRRTDFVFGYRHMDIDYEDGSGSDLFRFEVAIDRPHLWREHPLLIKSSFHSLRHNGGDVFTDIACISHNPVEFCVRVEVGCVASQYLAGRVSHDKTSFTTDRNFLRSGSRHRDRNGRQQGNR